MLAPMSRELLPEDLVVLNRLTVVARVLAGTAHDINNALQIISGSAELLAGLGEVSGPARRAVDRIQAQSTRAAGAVHEVMQFARDRGETSARVSLKEVVAKAIAMRAFLIRRAGLVLDFDAASAPAAFVRGSSTRLQQAVLNLIINAEQASQAVQNGSIHVELEEGTDAAILRIVDYGRGLDPATTDRAFEPFVTGRMVADASGLGLTAARIIARNHGGDVGFEPRVSGTCVVLRVPLSRE
jgi:signal transduction histidine kinase